MIPYCLPVVESSCEAVYRLILANRTKYDFVEVWLDTIADFSLAFLDDIVNRLGESLILLFRRPLLAPVQMSWFWRTQVMQWLHRTPVLLDLDVATQTQELEFLQERHLSVALIASYHNYQETPSSAELDMWVERMASHKPAIYKLATYCHSPQDALRLLQLGLDLQAKQRPCIVLGMGEHGTITRIFGSLWFNQMIFAPPDLTTASAPGQLSRPQLEKIWQNLKGNKAR